MGKSKKPRIANFHHHDGPKSRSSTAAIGSGAGAGTGGPKKMKSFSRVSTSAPAFKEAHGGAKEKPNSKNANANAQSRPPTIPFQKGDRILLVGEGDFSFALSLAMHHGCKNLLATSYDAEQALYEKYPQAKLHIEKLCSRGSETSSSPSRPLKRKREETEGFENDDSDNEEKEEREAKDEDQNPKTQDIEQKRPETQDAQNQVPKVLFSIDARKLGSGLAGGAKAIRNGFPRATAPLPVGKNRNHRPWKDATNSLQHQNHQQHTGHGGPWDIICFNFPHVGGLSTDVNRQVRANQELLVSFFKACIPLLSEPAVLPITSQGGEDDDDDDDDGWPDDSHSEPGTDSDIEKKKEKQTPRIAPGQILVSLFEGEPYTLWNIRDLARHAGLRVVTSFRFPWASYPGYSHARTIGEIEKRNGGPGRGGWRGEDREARMYVFEKRGAEGVAGAGSGAASGKKRKKGGKGRGGENSDDDSD
ncbi:hypothetical protein EMPG_15117 [Blastomyces silverae]|uniref:25S rRNA (uridine-N(3))-methyltransferase BMT5-like domain-containing protein n=1 Tax=Blastomyces silverae TaxID=2060906 RepID=A0A0H1BJX1_9EURO|nr:hypothetical protein EMPG_15117 [Blastomyces silverae]